VAERRLAPGEVLLLSKIESRRVTAAALAASALVLVVGAFVSRGFTEEQSEQAAVLDRQAAEYRAATSKTILQLQQFRETETTAAEGSGGKRGTATLVNLNPRINSWFLLTLNWGTGMTLTYHLENPKPQAQTIHLGATNPHGIEISAAGHTKDCHLWFGADDSLAAGQRSGLPYAPLCGGDLYLRNRVAGRYTMLELMSGFLRDHVWGGEEVVGLVRKEFFKDRFLDQGQQEAAAPSTKVSEHPDWPLPGSVEESDRPVAPNNLGIDAGRPVRSLLAGQWYPAVGVRGVYVSFIEPRLISSNILSSYPNLVSNLNSVEASAMVYLVAFDLNQLGLGFALGTDHPRVGWSPRPPANMRDDLRGPDGINTAAPLVTNGIISPALTDRTVAAFAGGFKREHGAFKYGPFSQLNHGSHYGFIEQGVVFSKLQPGLATLYVLDDGTIWMKTWTDADDALLNRIKFARQNGVPLIEYNATTKTSEPGSLVARWGPGNWSGSADEDLRSLRAGACIQETPTRQFLIYGFFSTAIPSAMTRVFQAYGCKYAMHLDMNAPELTYLALYVHQGSQLKVEYLAQSMADTDKKTDSEVLWRFLVYPDNRDFFYLYRRDEKK
jgi:hypothetical protein